MDNSCVTVQVGFNWAFKYVTQFESWLNAGLPRFSHCKFHKYNVASGKDAAYW